MRGAGRAAGDHAATGLLPRICRTRQLPQDNPADPVLIYASIRTRCRSNRIDDYASRSSPEAGDVKGVSESRIFGQKPYAVTSVNPERWRRAHRLEEVRTALTQATVNREGRLEGGIKRSRSTPTTRIFKPTASVPHHRLAQWGAGAARRYRRLKDSFQNLRSDAWFEVSRGVWDPGEPAPTRSGVDTIKSLLPKTAGIDPAYRACRPNLIPLAGNPRRGARRAVYDLLTIALVILVIFIFCGGLGDSDPEHSGALSLLATFAACTASATASTHLAMALRSRSALWSDTRSS